jgi:hypothetical protein
MSFRKGLAKYARNVDISYKLTIYYDIKLDIQQITVTKRGRPDRRLRSVRGILGTWINLFLPLAFRSSVFPMPVPFQLRLSFPFPPLRLPPPQASRPNSILESKP